MPARAGNVVLFVICFRDHRQHVWRRLLHGAAYLRDMFGTRYVGAITASCSPHGRRPASPARC